MATSNEIHMISWMLSELIKQIKLCDELAWALIEVNWPLYRTWPSEKSDHEKACAQVIRSCDSILARIRAIRKTVLSPSLIHSQAQVVEILSCCRRCKNENQEMFRNGDPFRCLIQFQTDVPENGFRFQITRGGQIIEQN